MWNRESDDGKYVGGGESMDGIDIMDVDMKIDDIFTVKVIDGIFDEDSQRVVPNLDPSEKTKGCIYMVKDENGESGKSEWVEYISKQENGVYKWVLLRDTVGKRRRRVSGYIEYVNDGYGRMNGEFGEECKIVLSVDNGRFC